MKLLRGLLQIGALLWLASALFAQSPDLAEKSHRAKELMAAGKAEQAIPIYRELVRALPDNPGLAMNLGLALDMAGRKREAVIQYKKVLALDPRQLPALQFLGTAYVDLGEPGKALEPLDKVVKAQPDNLDAQEVLAEAQLSLGKLEEASKRFAELARAIPENPKAWYGLGLSYERLAQRHFDELSKSAMGSAYWLDLVAESRFKRTQYFSAFFFYRQALAKMPTLRGAHAGLAEVYKKTNHPDWAAVEEDRERALPPPDCGVDKLVCAFRAGDYLDVITAAGDARTEEAYYWCTRAYSKLALEAFSRLGQLPPSAEMHELLAKLQSERRQYVESAKEWRAALALAPENAHFQEGLAVALYQSGDLPGAKVLLEDLVKRRPDAAGLNYMLGDTLLNSQKPQEAVTYLKKAVTVQPRLLAAQSSLARAYLALGEAEKAIPHLKAALPIDDDGSLHYQLGRAYQARGETALARQMLKQYQEIHTTQEAENKAVEKEVEITAP